MEGNHINIYKPYGNRSSEGGGEDYFSSDWHLGHKNILKYDKRPFKNIEDHDYTILENYNGLVQPRDNFYFLGDFAFSLSIMERTLEQMNGNLFFIKGNHDGRDHIKLYKKYGEYLGQQEKVKFGAQEIVLNHFKLFVWDKVHHGAWHLYAHNHGSLELKHLQFGKSFDVAINITGYNVLSFPQISKRMEKLEPHPDQGRRRDAVRD